MTVSLRKDASNLIIPVTFGGSVPDPKETSDSVDLSAQTVSEKSRKITARFLFHVLFQNKHKKIIIFKRVSYIDSYIIYKNSKKSRNEICKPKMTKKEINEAV